MPPLKTSNTHLNTNSSIPIQNTISTPQTPIQNTVTKTDTQKTPTYKPNNRTPPTVQSTDLSQEKESSTWQYQTVTTTEHSPTTLPTPTKITDSNKTPKYKPNNRTPPTVQSTDLSGEEESSTWQYQAVTTTKHSPTTLSTPTKITNQRKTLRPREYAPSTPTPKPYVLTNQKHQQYEKIQGQDQSLDGAQNRVVHVS